MAQASRPAPGSTRLTPYFYAGPAMIVMIAVVVYPLLFGFYLSMTNMSMSNFLKYKLIWFRNFGQIFADPVFYKVLVRTVIWTVVNVFFHVTIGLWLAILLHRKLPGKAIMRLLLILPWAMPQYIVALTWKTMFNFQYGAVNQLLGKLNVFLDSLLGIFGISKGFAIPAIQWLSDPVWAFVAVVITNVWLGFPFMMMISLGGLQSIPHELYEAADVDGASGWAKFRNITLPLLRPVLVPAIVLGTVWTFNMLNVIYLVTMGGPGESTHILVSYVYRAAFDFYRYGYAAAFSVVIFAILLLFGITFIRQMRGTEAVQE